MNLILFGSTYRDEMSQARKKVKAIFPGTWQSSDFNLFCCFAVLYVDEKDNQKMFALFDLFLLFLRMNLAAVNSLPLN